MSWSGAQGYSIALSQSESCPHSIREIGFHLAWVSSFDRAVRFQARPEVLVDEKCGMARGLRELRDGRIVVGLSVTRHKPPEEAALELCGVEVIDLETNAREVTQWGSGLEVYDVIEV